MEMKIEIERENAHWREFEKLAKEIGVDALRKLVLSITTEETIRNLLASGDEHLNKVPLGKWDRIAGVVGNRIGPDYPTLNFHPPFRPSKANGLSLSDRVCVLKHVAIYHIEKEKDKVGDRLNREYDRGAYPTENPEEDQSDIGGNEL